MESKHTPGPWYVDEDPRQGMEWNRQIMADRNTAICFMSHSAGAKPEQDEQNARLIAAAPELLYALLLILPDAEMEDCGGADIGHRLATAHAAIAKATTP